MPARRVPLLLPLLLGAVFAGCFDTAPALVDVGAEVVRPGPVALLAPAHGERVDGRGVVFTWAFVAEGLGNAVGTAPTDPVRDTVNATAWTARLLLDGAPVDACAADAGRTTCTLTLEPGRVYRWSVEASRDGAPPVFSSERGFYTNAPPTAPAFEPGDEGTTQAPLDPLWLAWTPSSDPDRDEVTYRVTMRNASGERVACEATAEPKCTVPWRMRAGERVTATVTPRDALGLEGPPATVNFTTMRPVVLLHGWTGDATTWSIMADTLLQAGVELLDFDIAAPGVQLLAYVPDESNGTIEEIATTDVLPEIRRALVDAGYTPDAPVDLVAHSMGGLVGRVLVEKEGHGAQFPTLTMVGTPHRGSPMSGPRLCRAGPEVWYASCLQMEEGSSFLEGLGYAPAPEGTAYFTIGGGRDTIAPDRSARLDGVPHHTVRNGCHSSNDCAMTIEGDAIPLTGSREVRDRILEILRLQPGPVG